MSFRSSTFYTVKADTQHSKEKAYAWPGCSHRQHFQPHGKQCKARLIHTDKNTTFPPKVRTHSPREIPQISQHSQTPIALALTQLQPKSRPTLSFECSPFSSDREMSLYRTGTAKPSQGSPPQAAKLPALWISVNPLSPAARARAQELPRLHHFSTGRPKPSRAGSWGGGLSPFFTANTAGLFIYLFQPPWSIKNHQNKHSRAWAKASWQLLCCELALSELARPSGTPSWSTQTARSFQTQLLRTLIALKTYTSKQ